MKSTKLFLSSIVLMAMVLVYSMQAEADLQTIGIATYNSTDYNLIYDTDLEITWLDYTNGRNNWTNQNSWASGLNGGGVLTYNFNAGVSMNWSDEWRLPTTTQPDPSCGYQYDPGGGLPLQGYGYNCTGSEMGHLYYTELGNTALGGLSNTDDFQNLQSDFYFSGSEYASHTNFVWGFQTASGYQYHLDKDYFTYAIAVRPGLAVVPEPISMVLFVTGGIVLAGRRTLSRRRHR